MYLKNLIASDPNWVDVLRTKYLINVVIDPETQLACLKYNQIESPMAEPIVQECRGTIVHVPTGTVVAWPYNKFWNQGEALAAQIDWPTARVLAKEDGSLILLFYWDGKWRVASSGHPTAGGSFGKGNKETFGEAFWRVFDALDMCNPHDSWSSLAFMFEFCDEANRIVVKHPKPRIIFHGARDSTTGEELDHDDLAQISASHKWELIKSYPLTSLAECDAAVRALNPIEAEGFVVVDQHFNRVKIKSPQYVALHHMKGEATLRRAIELWQTGETEELLTHFPEFREKIEPVHEKLIDIATLAATDACDWNNLDRKSYAMQVKDKLWATLAFKLYGTCPTKDDAAAVMRKLPLSALETMLDKYEKWLDNERAVD